MDQILALFWTILRKELKSEIDWTQSKQARKPRSYASPKLCPPTHLLTD